tara:strand:+ start:1025 stop:1921 length:897 start_codon:yes stop_codon:yes gene_type:complete
MNKFLSLLEKLESEENQKRIKRINIVISFIAVTFIFNLLNSFEFSIIEIDLNLIYPILVYIIFLLSSFFIWKRFLINNKIEVNSNYLSNWALSNINKYIPGGIGLSITRFSITKNISKDSKKILYGLIEDQFKHFILIFPFLIFSFLINDLTFKIYFYLVSIIAFILLYLKISKIYSRKLKFVSLFFNNKILIILNNLINISFNFLILLRVLDRYEASELFYIAILYTVSASISLLFIGSPAGLGIREIIFYFYSTNILNSQEIATFLLITRVLTIFSDILFFLIDKASLFYGKKNKF